MKENMFVVPQIKQLLGDHCFSTKPMLHKEEPGSNLKKSAGPF
jgi:hypothetical protein